MYVLFPFCSKYLSGWPPPVSLSGFTAGMERLVLMQLMQCMYITIVITTKLSAETVDLFPVSAIRVLAAQ